MIFCKLKGLQLIAVALLLLGSLAVSAQNTSSHIKHADVVNSKVDSASYVLTERQVLLISKLLAYGDDAAGNSDKISTRDYNNFHYQVLKVDSILRVQYAKKHPKKDAKKP